MSHALKIFMQMDNRENGWEVSLFTLITINPLNP